MAVAVRKGCERRGKRVPCVIKKASRLRRPLKPGPVNKNKSQQCQRVIIPRKRKNQPLTRASGKQGGLAEKAKEEEGDSDRKKQRVWPKAKKTPSLRRDEWALCGEKRGEGTTPR